MTRQELEHLIRAAPIPLQALNQIFARIATRPDSPTLGADMKTDTQIWQEGMQALIDQLGLVEAARFVALLSRDPFDYTAWRQSQWVNEPLGSLVDKAKALRLAEH